MSKRPVLILLFMLVSTPALAQPVVESGSAAGDEIDLKAGLTLSDLMPNRSEENRTFSPLFRKPGVALLGSALVPGLGQTANRKWIRAGAYVAAEALLLALHFNSVNRARSLEDRYENFADNSWSVVSYAQWLVDYHQVHGLSNPYITELQQQIQGVNAAYEPGIDWQAVDLELLRNVEQNTPFVTASGVGNMFSHVLPDYGSQQYYELISKYYQFGPGWSDFGVDRNGNTLDNIYLLSWDGSDMPPNFLEGAGLANRFNDRYRLAGNMISLLILNHMVSAFDAFITTKLLNRSVEMESNLFNPAQQLSVKVRF
ncbi:MAG: hypothetical protein R3211_10540 [Balneolaceae bacterium]|nr:hypothetical protein [Balneolaceae bacterium]